MPKNMTAEKKDESNIDLALYKARQKVIEAIPLIIDAFITKAQIQASHQHAKFLFEFADGGHGGGNSAGDEESLAEMLMKELKGSSEHRETS